MSKFGSGRKGRRGVTLVELAVVIVIIGVLASFGVPQFVKSVERSKAVEAFNFLSAVRSAQERYVAREGTYASELNLLDLSWKKDSNGNVVLQYFTLDPKSDVSATETTWSVVVHRSGSSAGFRYDVGYDHNGYNASLGSSPIPAEINPMGTGNGGDPTNNQGR
jgi:prepilin-type N-terminal cleavage/methylation domain-containing protein